MASHHSEFDNALSRPGQSGSRVYEVEMLDDVKKPLESDLYRLAKGDRLTVDSNGRCELSTRGGKATGTINSNDPPKFFADLQFEAGGRYAGVRYILQSTTTSVESDPSKLGIGYVFGVPGGYAPGTMSNRGPGGGSWGDPLGPQTMGPGGAPNTRPSVGLTGDSIKASDQINFTLKFVSDSTDTLT